MPQTPVGLKTDWQRVTSYAWAIFRAVAEGTSGDVLQEAQNWAEMFMHAFKPPYVNVVLPACNTPGTEVANFQNRLPLDRLLRRLNELVREVEKMPTHEAQEQYLVHMGSCQIF